MPIALSPPEVCSVKTSVALYFSGSAVSRPEVVLLEFVLAFAFAGDAFTLMFAFTFVFAAGWQPLRNSKDAAAPSSPILKTIRSMLVNIGASENAHQARRLSDCVNGGFGELRITRRIESSEMRWCCNTNPFCEFCCESFTTEPQSSTEITDQERDYATSEM